MKYVIAFATLIFSTAFATAGTWPPGTGTVKPKPSITVCDYLNRCSSNADVIATIPLLPDTKVEFLDMQCVFTTKNKK